MNRIATLIAALTLFAFACADSPDPEPDTYPATLRAGANLDDAPACDATTTCPDGLSCAYLDLTGDDPGARCVDLGEICDLLDCGDGECLVRESYPVQIGCATQGGAGGDGDDPVTQP